MSVTAVTERLGGFLANRTTRRKTDTGPSSSARNRATYSGRRATTLKIARCKLLACQLVASLADELAS